MRLGFILFSQFFILAIALSSFYLRQDEITLDPGLGWHIKTGEYILENGSIPANDPFLSSHNSWICDQWLMDVGMYLTHHFGSWELLAALVPVLLTLFIYIVLHRLLVTEKPGNILPLLVCTIVYSVLQLQYLVRPFLFSYLFFIICYWLVLKRYRAPESSKLWPFLLLFVVWTNVHPSFILGILMLCAAFGASLCLEVLGKPVSIASRKWAVLILSCLTVTLVNPFFYHLHLSVFDLGSSKYFMELHTEWQPFLYKGIIGMSVMTLLISSIAYLFYERNFTKEKNLFFLFGILGFMHLGFEGIRMIIYFSIFASVPTLLGASQLPLKNLFVLRTIPEIERLKIPAGVNLISFIIIALFFPFAALTDGPLALKDMSPKRSTYPYGAIEWINQVARTVHQDEEVIVMARSDFGGFITFFSEQNVSAVMDDRNTLLGEDRYKKMMDGFHDPEVMLEMAEEEGARYLLLHNKTASCRELKALGTHQQCFEDEHSTVFLVNKSASCPLVEADKA